MTEIAINQVKKVFDEHTVIDNLSLVIPEGSLFTLLGPSGCGKTTLLRMIAGFNSIEAGTICFDNSVVNHMEPNKRNIGMVFQNYAIFPHLTVRDNVAFGLKQKKDIKKEKVVSETQKYLELMQIDQFAERKPDQLSGGQQQRVALARALAINPSILLMDEPLSNLDAKLRVEMRQAIRDIQKDVGITTVYVTHDQEEAMAISDNIAVMKLGEIQQIGTPKELYHRPANTFVASFIGRTNLMNANLVKEHGKAYLTFDDSEKLRCPQLDHVSEQKVIVSIRPEEFIRTDAGEMEGVIQDSIYLGQNTEYYVKTAFAETIQVSEESTFEEDHHINDRVRLAINMDKINIFNEDGSVNLTSEV